MGIMTEEAPRVKRANVFENAVLIRLRFGKLGNRRQLPASAIETDSDDDMVAGRKRLLDSDEIDAITSFDCEVSRWIKRKCIHSDYGEGLYWVPIGAIERVEGYLRDRKAARQEKIEAVLAAYPQRIEEAREKLRSNFNAGDYPTEDRLRRIYYMDWEYVDFGVPGRLEQVAPALFKQQLDKMKGRVEQAAIAAEQLVRQEFLGLVEAMQERLASEPGKPRKRFNASLLTNMTEFLQDFPLRDITNDEQLAKLAEKMRDILGGVDVEDLRESNRLRNRIAASAGEIRQQLSALIEEAPEREISFEDEV